MRVLIHASRTFDRAGYHRIQRDFAEIAVPLPNHFEYGGVIGSALLAECVTSSESRWFEGPYGLVFREPITSEFRPCRGRVFPMFFEPEFL